MSVLETVDALVPATTVCTDVVNAVNRHHEKPGLEVRLRDAIEAAKIPGRFRAACNERAQASALQVVRIASTIARQSAEAAKAHDTTLLPAGDSNAYAAISKRFSAAAGNARRGFAKAVALLEIHGVDLLYHAATSAMNATVGWATSPILPFAAPVVGAVVGALGFEVHQVTHVIEVSPSEALRKHLNGAHQTSHGTASLVTAPVPTPVYAALS